MKLILLHTKSDGCTYSCEQVTPFEYDSEEALIVLFEEKLDEAIDKSYHHFTVLGEQLCVSDFYHYDSQVKYFPDIMTLDNWFELNKRVEICPKEI